MPLGPSLKPLESVAEFPSGCFVVDEEVVAQAHVMDLWDELWRPERGPLRELMEAVRLGKILVDEQGELLGEEFQAHALSMFRIHGEGGETSYSDS